MAKAAPPTSRTRVRRLPARGAYDRSVIDEILDEGLVAHVGFVHDGAPFVIPMGYARDGDRILLHGSAASRLMRLLASGVEAAVTVTLLDALVLARSAVPHSMKYPSGVVLGRPSEVRDDEAKRRALDCLVDRLVPGRASDSRPANARELRATLVVELPIHEASAKARSGPPSDDDEDLALPHWAGLIPARTVWGPPAPAPDLRPGIEAPAYAAGYRRPGEAG